MTARRPVGMLVAIGIAALPLAAVAHAELDKSNPPNGANVLTAPAFVAAELLDAP